MLGSGASWKSWRVWAASLGSLLWLFRSVCLRGVRGAGFGCAVGFEFGGQVQDVEQQPTDGIGGVVDGSTDAELYVLLGKFFDGLSAEVSR